METNKMNDSNTPMTKTGMFKTLRFLEHEIKNFEAIANRIKPSSGEIPELQGIEIYGETLPLNGIAGGDHIIYVDFRKRYDLEHRIEEAKHSNRFEIVDNLERNRHRSGILLADAAGHNITDALLAAMLHQAFLTGVQYELKDHGEVTGELFEILNTRFFNSSSLSKFVTLIYGEIHESGTFRFINAGHPPPVVFSHKYDKIIRIQNDRVVNYPPIGTLPSKDDIDSRFNFSRLGYKKKYSVNELNLMGYGDILLLYTDGFSEHGEPGNEYFKVRLENKVKEIKLAPAREIFKEVKQDLLNFATPEDDISFVVIKRTNR